MLKSKDITAGTILQNKQTGIIYMVLSKFKHYRGRDNINMIKCFVLKSSLFFRANQIYNFSLDAVRERDQIII